MPFPLSLLGKPSDHRDVVEFLKSIGADPPVLNEGDYDTYAVAPARGLELVFTDEAYFNQDDAMAIGEGALLLTNATFQTSAAEGYTTYAEPLPFGARFDMTRDALRALLGPPEKSDDDLCFDRWTVDGFWFFARYAEDFSELVDCAVQVPGTDDDD